MSTITINLPDSRLESRVVRYLHRLGIEPQYTISAVSDEEMAEIAEELNAMTEEDAALIHVATVKVKKVNGRYERV